MSDNQYIDGHRSLFATAARIDLENILDATMADYKFDYCTFGFNTSPSLCHRGPQGRKRNETLRANMEFKSTLLKSINVIVNMEFDSNIFVDKARRIMKDYLKWTANISDVCFIKMPRHERYLKECLQKISS